MATIKAIESVGIFFILRVVYLAIRMRNAMLQMG
jgi:hypothetical protein